MADDGATVRGFRSFFEDPNVRFPKKPRLVEDVAIYQMPDGLGVQFRGGPAATVLRGREAEKVLGFLLPALDGNRGLADLIERCPAGISTATLLQALHVLHTKGLLCEGDQNPVSLPEVSTIAPDVTLQRQLLFWGRKLRITGCNDYSRDVQAKLESRNILIVATGLFGTATADLLLRTGCSRLRVIAWDDSGVVADSLANSNNGCPIATISRVCVDDAIASVRDFLESADLVVTATRNAPIELFRSLNRMCLDFARPLLCADEDGVQLVLGPFIQPYSSACYTCLELRRASVTEFMLEEHLYQTHLLRERTSGRSKPIGEALPFATLSASLVVSEVIRIVTAIEPPTVVNGQLTLPLLAGEPQVNRILRVPRCPDCQRGGRTS